MKRIILLQLLLLASVAAAATDPNLVGWWNFDDGNGTTAVDSAGGHNGTLINGPKWTTGKIGGGLRFDGINDYVEVPYSDSLGPGYITLSAWVRPDTVSRSMMLIGKSRYSDCSSEQYALSIGTGAKPSSSIKRNSSCAIGLGWKEVWPSSSIVAGQWYLVTSTWDGSVFKIYINGELSGTNSGIPAGLIDYCPGGTLRFGIWWSQGQAPFQGVMDDIRIYNRALSAEEIQQLYSPAPVDSNDSDLVGWWKLDDSNGTTVSDSAGTRNGTIYGATWATGQVGGALSFDGVNDYAELPTNSPTWLPQKDLTVSTWAYFYGDPLSDLHDFLLDLDFSYWSDHALCTGYGLYRTAGDGKAVFQIETTTTTDIVGSNVTLMKNRWYHIVGVRHGTTLEIYLDGQLNAASVCSADPIKFSGNCVNHRAILGKVSDDCGSPGAYFHNGMLDDVRIYNRALSADEIQQLYSPAATDSNLVGWWKLDDSNGATATDSAGHNNGTLNGNAKWAAGMVGGALDCDGNGDYVSVPDNDSLTPSNEITIAYWLYNRGGGSGVYKVAWCSNSRAYAFDAGTNAHLMVCQTRDAIDDIISIGTISLNQWHYLAATFNRGQASLYIDGQFDSTKMLSVTSIMNDTQPLIIGGYWEYCTPAFVNSLNGRIDDVRIYNRALSADEIHQLYTSEEVNEPVPVTLAGLEIAGPAEVAEDSSASYKAIAHYSDGTTKDVTTPAEWRVEPNIVAAINAGQLTTKQALYPKHKVMVYAKYTEGQITVDTNLPVLVLAICPQGNALLFDGVNDYVQIPNSPKNQITTNQMSISAWIMLTRDVGPTQRRIINKQQTNPICWGLEIGGKGYAGLVGNQVVFHDSSGTTYRNCISPMNLIPGQWYHIGVSDNAGKIRLYINGQLSQSIDNGYGIPSQITAPIIIGSTYPDPTFYFDGTIDEVAVFNRALSADELRKMMNTKLTGGETNLVAYWDFDAGTGQTVADVSGHGNNGVLGSGTGIDIADPCWVESEAPVGLCTIEQVMLRDLLGATDDKETASQLITDAKAKERASVLLITELQKQMNNKDLMNAYRAKLQIGVAVVQEEMVSRQLDATIKRLEDALQLLNYEVDSNSRPPIPWQWQLFDGKRDKAPQILPLYLDCRPGVKK